MQEASALIQHSSTRSVNDLPSEEAAVGPSEPTLASLAAPVGERTPSCQPLTHLLDQSQVAQLPATLPLSRPQRILQLATELPRADNAAEGGESRVDGRSRYLNTYSPLGIWLWVCYNKVPIYPIFYLLKGDYTQGALDWPMNSPFS